ncbi:hypothetical protein TNCV_3847951 [Trichonephila clavipes]|nr:hypothetical protein TNCV_3847951 [Trichonephila clavipes]
MSKSLALKASQRIRDVWSDWAMEIGHFNSLWKVRRIKGQDEVLCIQHLSIPPYRYSPNITDLLACMFSLISSVDTLTKSADFIRAVACFADDASRNKSPERILRIVLTSPILLLVKAFSIRKEPVLETAELITSRLTGAGSLLPPVYGEAWAKGHATGTPDSTFPGTGRRTRQTCGSDSKPVLTLRKLKKCKFVRNCFCDSWQILNVDFDYYLISDARHLFNAVATRQCISCPMYHPVSIEVTEVKFKESRTDQVDSKSLE